MIKEKKVNLASFFFILSFLVFKAYLGHFFASRCEVLVYSIFGQIALIFTSL